MSPQPWRVLFTGKNRGAFNMAVDAAVLQEVEGHRSPPTLRIYGWNPFCVSLGYFQDPARELDADALRSRGWDFVLRPTGGRAVLHAAEITYSLIARCDEAPWCASLAASSERIARAWAAALEGFDVRLVAGISGNRTPLQSPPQPAPPCFASASRSELVFGQRKVVGSAQRRIRGAFLQHGSIPLTREHERLVEVLRLMDSKRHEYQGILRNHAISLGEIGVVPLDDMEKWTSGLAETVLRVLEASGENRGMTGFEAERVEGIEKMHMARQRTFFEAMGNSEIPA